MYTMNHGINFNKISESQEFNLLSLTCIKIRKYIYKRFTDHKVEKFAMRIDKQDKQLR